MKHDMLTTKRVALNNVAACDNDRHHVFPLRMCAHQFSRHVFFLLVGAWPTLDVARIHITLLTTTEREPYARATHYRWHCHMSSITSTFPQRAAISSHYPSTHRNIKRIISLALYHYYKMATASETLPSIEIPSASCLWRSTTSTRSAGF